MREALDRQKEVISDLKVAIADTSATVAAYVPFLNDAKLQELCQQLEESHEALRTQAD